MIGDGMESDGQVAGSAFDKSDLTTGVLEGKPPTKEGRATYHRIHEHIAVRES
jgi:hypothetical protein